MIPHSRRTFSSPARARHAFSLVEVVLSLGIVSFAMVTLLGLVPVGLGIARNAIDITVESQIAQSVSSDIQLTDFSNLQSTNLYYNQEGSSVPESDPGALFEVMVRPDALQAPATLSTNAVKCVSIQIIKRTSPSITNSYSVVVANNNR